MTKCSICNKTYCYDGTERCDYCDGMTFIGLRRCLKCKKGQVSLRKPCIICNPKGEIGDKQTIIY